MKLNLYAVSAKAGRFLKEKIFGSEAAKDNRGIGVVEILLILVVLIGLVIIFKSQISSVISSAFSSINKNVSTIIN